MRLIIPFLVIFIFSCQGQNPNDSFPIFVQEKKVKNHLEFYKLKGNVKTLKEFHYDTFSPSRKEGKDKLRYRFTRKFNTYGNLIEWKQFRVDSSIAYFENYFYNENQQLIKKLVEDGTHTFLYDSRGNKTNEQVLFKDSVTIISQKKYKYDSKDRVISSTYYPLRSPSSEKVFSYDNKNRIIELVIKNSSGFYQTKFKHTDTTERRTDFSKKNKDDKYPATPSIDQVSTYDKNGNIISIKSKMTTEYDDSVSESKFEYELDAKGNWIKKNQINSKGKPLLLESRILEYY